jgi:S-adenosylmethionine:tRNA-ribosyltransferase-isomerase (queuine synthetase)
MELLVITKEFVRITETRKHASIFDFNRSFSNIIKPNSRKIIKTYFYLLHMIKESLIHILIEEQCHSNLWYQWVRLYKHCSIELNISVHSVIKRCVVEKKKSNDYKKKQSAPSGYHHHLRLNFNRTIFCAEKRATISPNCYQIKCDFALLKKKKI